jgi:hypothetical protein
VSRMSHESGTRKLQGSQNLESDTTERSCNATSATAPDSWPADQRHAVHARGACEADSSATVRDSQCAAPARQVGEGVQDNPCLLQAREAGTPLYQPALICPSGPGPTMPPGHVAAVPVDGFSKHMLLHGYSIRSGVIYMRAYSTWRCGCIPVQGSRGPGAGRQTRQPALVPSTWQEKPAGVTDQS